MDFIRLIPRLPWISAILLVFALLEAIRTLRFHRTGIRAQGTVVEIDSSNEGNTPIIGFQAEDGKGYRFPARTVLPKEDWSLGARWPVIYARSNPRQARVDKPSQHWTMVIFYIAASVVTFVIFTGLRIVFVK